MCICIDAYAWPGADDVFKNPSKKNARKICGLKAEERGEGTVGRAPGAGGSPPTLTTPYICLLVFVSPILCRLFFPSFSHVQKKYGHRNVLFFFKSVPGVALLRSLSYNARFMLSGPYPCPFEDFARPRHALYPDFAAVMAYTS